jgi:hypothetical protein
MNNLTSDFSESTSYSESDTSFIISSTSEYIKIESESESDNYNEFITDDFVKLCKNYDYIPTVQPKTRRIIALGDIHGDYPLVLKLLKIGKVIDIDGADNINWIGGDTIVVQVGDQIDSCRPKSINADCNIEGSTINDEGNDILILQFFTDLHYKAKEHGGQVISLLGNHELMNVTGYMDYVSKMNLDKFKDYKDDKKPELKFNTEKEARYHAFKPGNEFGTYLGCTRVSCVIIGSNLFVHAGIIDSILDELKVKKQKDIESIDIKIRKWLLGLINKEYIKHIINGSEKSMFWTRILGNIPHNMSSENNKCIEHIGNVVKILQIGKIVIGHTPQSFIHGQGINSVCDNSVWRVDNGSSHAFHGFDKDYLATGKININREPQVLEILNDTQFNILK